jgi:hypothetical protein
MEVTKWLKPAPAIEVQDSAPRLDYIRATPAAHLQSGKTPRRTSKGDFAVDAGQLGILIG